MRSEEWRFGEEWWLRKCKHNLGHLTTHRQAKISIDDFYHWGNAISICLWILTMQVHVPVGFIQMWTQLQTVSNISCSKAQIRLEIHHKVQIQYYWELFMFKSSNKARNPPQIPNSILLGTARLTLVNLSHERTTKPSILWGNGRLETLFEHK